jgi:hypothetical protein
MNKTTLWFRDWMASGIVSPASGDAVFLVCITYTPPIRGQRTIEIFGVTFGSATVDVTVETGATAATMAATVAPSGRFEAQLSFATTRADETGVVRAVNRDTGTSGEDRAAFAFKDAGIIELDPHGVLLVEAGKLEYAAGSPDRLQYTRTFVKVEPEPSFWIQTMGNAVFGNQAKGFYRFNGPKIARQVKKSLTDIRKKLETGKATFGEYRRLLRKELKENAVATIERAPKDTAALIQKMSEERSAWRNALQERDHHDNALRVRRYFGHRVATPSGGVTAPSKPPAHPVFATYVVGMPDRKFKNPTELLEEAVEEMVDYFLAYSEAYLRLGVLFHERTRIRPTNQIFGEPIFQLALTPGEELQIRQTSETKRRTAFSEISDQESEQQTTFSSTWSTDMASTIASESSFQQSTNIGAGVSGEVPQVPVTVSANVATSTSTADSWSSQSTATLRRERTETASARMRQQHRVQIELAAEESQSLGTTRTLRNFNQQRSMLHTFFKIYRKEQVTLERHDAQLCLRLTVVDPARTTRGTFLANLNKIDPQLLAWRNITPPAAEIREQFFFTVNAPNNDGGFFHGYRVDREKTRSLDLRAETGVDGDFVLSAPPQFVMTECGLAFYGDANLHSNDPDDDFDPDAVPESQLTEVIPNVHVGWSFCRSGGTVHWVTEPEVESETANCSMRLNLPLFYTAPSLLGEKIMEITHVRFRVETLWGPSDQARIDYLSRVHAERLRLSGEFKVELVLALHAIAEADYPHTVLDRALAENLSYPAGFEFRQIKEIFDIEGVMIDNVPYWAQPHTREEHTELMLRLQRLPIQLALHSLLTDSLTASQAVVYLPVKAGMEEHALRLLPEATKLADDIANNFRRFCDDHYGRLKTFDVPNLANHMGPAPVLATPPDAPDWANDWERPQNKFDILGQWSEMVPTDGVHVETHLSNTVVTDEHERNRLVRLVSTPS